MAIDGSDAGHGALDLAAEWAGLQGADVKVLRWSSRRAAAHPFPPTTAGRPGDPPSASRCTGRPGVPATGSWRARIADAATAFGADVIVVGVDHRRLASHRMAPSLREQLTRVTALPVLVAPDHPADARPKLPARQALGDITEAAHVPTRAATPVFDSVVVGATDSEGATRAFRRALAVARTTGGTLHVVTAINGKGEAESAPWLPEEFRYTDAGAGATDWLLTQLAKEAAAADVQVTTHPVLDDPAARHHPGGGGGGGRPGRRRVGLGPRRPRRSRHVPKAVMDHAACAVLVV